MNLNIIKKSTFIISGILIILSLSPIAYGLEPITQAGVDAYKNQQKPEDKITSLVCNPPSTIETRTDYERLFKNSLKGAAANAVSRVFKIYTGIGSGTAGVTGEKILAASQDQVACSRPATGSDDCKKAEGEQPAQDDNGNWKCFTAPTSITRAGDIGTIGIKPYKSIIPIPCQNIPGISNINCSASYGTPGAYVLRIYQFALLLVGMAAFGQIVFGGLEYILAAGSFTKIDNAKKRIWDALSGLLLLLGAYFVLYNINPDLVSLRDPYAPVLDIRDEAAQAQQDLQRASDAFTGGSGGAGGGSGSSSGGSLCKVSLNLGITVNTNIRFEGIQFMNDDDTKTQLAQPRDIPQAPKSICQECKANAALDTSFGECKCKAGFEQKGGECVLIPFTN